MSGAKMSGRIHTAKDAKYVWLFGWLYFREAEAFQGLKQVTQQNRQEIPLLSHTAAIFIAY